LHARVADATGGISHAARPSLYGNAQASANWLGTNAKAADPSPIARVDLAA